MEVPFDLWSTKGQLNLEIPLLGEGGISLLFYLFILNSIYHFQKKGICLTQHSPKEEIYHLSYRPLIMAENLTFFNELVTHTPNGSEPTTSPST